MELMWQIHVVVNLAAAMKIGWLNRYKNFTTSYPSVAQWMSEVAENAAPSTHRQIETRSTTILPGAI
ncbi:hypothetical protein EVAR_92272_1 [Eumeta japonica]|uniref:Uncharacterized protein n=1 Tax=Eumeta variegata TaxID=151549 RepID=A0A4C1TNJ2_EUMVA|nr:hypothetical protein EVAR_92272_1 [Eumeta japonica]